mmetsp:Transcript_33700/g.60988  ORF Transcript_33700/g.60988 Transcript_33700/m.60988 type:complete len:203 (+) Transcript_33700:127-735(+)
MVHFPWHWALLIWVLCILVVPEREGLQDLTDGLEASRQKNVRAHVENSSVPPEQTWSYQNARAEAIELQKQSKAHVEHAEGPLIDSTEEYLKNNEEYEDNVEKLHGAEEAYKKLVSKFRLSSREENSNKMEAVKEDLDKQVDEVQSQDDAASDASTQGNGEDKGGKHGSSLIAADRVLMESQEDFFGSSSFAQDMTDSLGIP